MQTPLPSGLDAATTTEQVMAGVALHGRLAVVTGGYAGLGLQTVRALLQAGAEVVVPARDMDRAQAQLAGLAVTVLPMDLAAPESIDAFASALLARQQPLSILINNAGVMACPLQHDPRGREIQLATNHLGHFQLTSRLWPALRAAQGARVVALSSRGHRLAAFDFDDPYFHQRPYDRWQAYGQSKTANALFAVSLDARGRAHGVRAFAVHPGAIYTDLVRHMSKDELRAAHALDEHDQPVADLSKGMKTLSQGAATTLWAATSSQLDDRGGLYLEDCDVAPLWTDDSADPVQTRALKGVRPYAVDPQLAERLWQWSEAETGLSWHTPAAE